MLCDLLVSLFIGEAHLIHLQRRRPRLANSSSMQVELGLGTGCQAFVRGTYRLRF